MNKTWKVGDFAITTKGTWTPKNHRVSRKRAKVYSPARCWDTPDIVKELFPNQWYWKMVPYQMIMYGTIGHWNRIRRRDRFVWLALGASLYWAGEPGVPDLVLDLLPIYNSEEYCYMIWWGG